MSIVYYEGDRIYFRPLEPSDEPQLRRWINDPRIWSTLGMRHPVNEVREREFIDRYGKDEHEYILGVTVRDGDRLIGTVGLHSINARARRTTLGIMIGDVESQNQGYGSEAVRLAVRFAFEELNLHRVDLHVFDHNPRAIRCYEKAGFVREGCLRQHSFRHGEYRDVYVYGQLRSEWLANRAAAGDHEMSSAGTSAGVA